MRAIGLTLLETLVALGVLTLLLGLGGFFWQGLRQEMQLREAAAQLATDLNRARAEARRRSEAWEVRISSGSEYWLGPQGSLSNRQLPHGARIVGSGTFTFSAPYGLLDVPDRSFQVELNGRRAWVNVVGVTGKVVVRREP